eukprot:scaffold61783_cov21-Tisochrysis_lutea.AAC.1
MALVGTLMTLVGMPMALAEGAGPDQPEGGGYTGDVGGWWKDGAAWKDGAVWNDGAVWKDGAVDSGYGVEPAKG